MPRPREARSTTRRRSRRPSPAQRLLSGAAGSNSIASNFAVGDTITVNGTTVTFVAAGAVGNQLNITDNITTMLAKIDSITGTANPSTIAGGAITLHTGTTSNLSVTSSNAAAFAALGFTPTVTATRGGGGTAGAGVVIGSDTTTFANESISGGAVTAYDATGTPVNLQLRWAKTDSAALGVRIPIPGTCSISPIRMRRGRKRRGSTPAPTLSSVPTER